MSIIELGGGSINKKTYIKQLLDANIRIDHMSSRRIDYKYLEYNLYLILFHYRNDYDFTLLGLPDNIEIITEPINSYNIYSMSHVTLNSELYKLYSCGYFNSEHDFIKYVTVVIKHYNNKKFTIKQLVKIIRRTRLNYINKKAI